MPSFIDRSGQRYGRLTVLQQEPSAGGRVRWKCLCDCGAFVFISSSGLSVTQSCGCLQREATAASNAIRIKHGHTRGHKTSPEWRSWKSMHDRCYLSSMPNYPLYGGRGISICDQWRGKDGFVQFYADMGKRPKGTTIDRIENDGNYEPGNCRWATDSEQAINRRDTAEIRSVRNASLDRGRAKMWSDPKIRGHLMEDRKSRPRGGDGRIKPK